MNSLAAAVLQSGLLDHSILEEMRRWGVPVDLLETDGKKPRSLDEVTDRLREALEGEGYVLVRETDLAVLQQYAATMQQGTLHLVLDTEDGPNESDLEVTYGRTPLNHYILAWKSMGIADVLTNGMTYLNDGTSRVYFHQVRELFFGDTKAFMICEPSASERLALSLP